MDLYELLYGKPSTGWNEEEFRRWYSEKAGKLGLSPDPDDPEHFYDYRAAFRAGASQDASGHWPSQFKLPGHPREIVGGINTRTGRPPEIPLRGPLGGLGAAFSTTAGLPPIPSTPEPSISRDVVMKSAADLGGYGVGAAETAAMLASGLFYMPAAGLAGLGAAFDPVISGTGGLDWEAGNRAIEGVMEWGTYKPKTEMGMASSQLAMKPFEALGKGADEAGEFVQEKSSPYVGEEVAAILGATTASLVEAAPMLIEPAYRGLRGLGNEGALKIFGKNITKDVDVPQISGKLMYGEKLTPEDIKAFEGKATAEGLTAEDIGRVTSRLQEYNEMKNFGHDVVWLPDMGEDVIMREGVLNTPSMDPESIRRQRVDKILYPDIEKGVRSSRTGKLVEGGSETTGIPSEIRGKKLQPFLNIPATEPALQQPRPANMPDYPVVVTGNPHLVNFRRPDPSWDSSVKVVRVKPVHRGTLANHEAVVSAIKYANEVGAKVLVTNFRAKQPWTLALYTDIVPNNPKQPGFYDYWKPNPKPRPKDIRMAPDWVPYIPKGKQVSEAFKRNGWKTHKELYGEGGTWW